MFLIFGPHFARRCYAPRIWNSYSQTYTRLPPIWWVSWLLNLLHIPVVITMVRLYMMLWRIIRHREQHQKRGDPKNEGILQHLVEKGRSTREILKTGEPVRISGDVSDDRPMVTDRACSRCG
ncbi:uncharacterized protein BDW43DRAFT_284078 [Aspergillus alliaceus]|uniref:uncharacterized protein n=1 Tax=Petromyces alliaceus TaxID=209559 RepID=UPI0012A68EFD|nr:uncharacterized protein BDW43DRAFT_284078 [Aspergillus alliaceus]KAB8230825.1 hypothetical protein BDW43DRAFT_284078 [Aspergillus alliaceus]